MKPNAFWICAALLVTTGAIAQNACADPCGMVPPIYIDGAQETLARIGRQKTYVFYKNGIETLVIRPGFTGNVDEFGMLVPFPTPPAIRKVADDVFPHIAAAIDPPQVVIDLRARRSAMMAMGFGGLNDEMDDSAMMAMMGGGPEEVRVIREEAVGMYEVVVLEAGSAAALKRWMKDHQYRFPDGMEDACQDYIRARWCFVAVKTRVGRKRNVDPVAGQRQIDPSLAPGSSFEGHVQAMGFRFRSRQLVVPMRLSTFNEGDLHNVVYLLADQPSRIVSVPSEFVVRQIPGEQLIQNLVEPLPLRIIGGRARNVGASDRVRLKSQRDATPHNGLARELFASDLACSSRGELANDFEETEKELLAIGEMLNLRAPTMDRLHRELLAEQQRAVTETALQDLEEMTLTVIDGDFPRDLLANENLAFASYKMPTHLNSPVSYDATKFGPGGVKSGTVVRGDLSAVGKADRRNDLFGFRSPVGIACFGLLSLVVVVGWKRGSQRSRFTFLGVLAFGVVTWCASGVSQAEEKDDKQAIAGLLSQVRQDQDPAAVLTEMREMGDRAMNELYSIALYSESMVERGWAVVCIQQIGSDRAKRALSFLQKRSDSPLVQTWTAAARVNLSTDVEDVVYGHYLLPGTMKDGSSWRSVLDRPITIRLEELLAEEDNDTSLRTLISYASSYPYLLATIAKSDRGQDSAELIRLMLTDKEQLVRRHAAGLLGSTAAGGKDAAVAREVIAALECSNDATGVPWAGGPLFLPGIRWEQANLTELQGRLLSWWIWCEHNSWLSDATILKNNLSNLGAVAGENVYASLDSWLFDWGMKAGPDSLQRLIDEHADARRQTIVDQLRLIASTDRRAFVESGLSWDRVAVLRSSFEESQVVFLTPRDPPTANVPADRVKTVLLSDEEWEQASVGGRYKNLLHVIRWESDHRHYGKFRHYGHWARTAYAGRDDLSPGFWVYRYPNWYVWRN